MKSNKIDSPSYRRRVRSSSTATSIRRKVTLESGDQLGFIDHVRWAETLKHLSAKELAGLPFGITQEHWPESLKQFVEDAVKLSLPRECTLASFYSSPGVVVSSESQTCRSACGHGNYYYNMTEPEKCAGTRNCDNSDNDHITHWRKNDNSLRRRFGQKNACNLQKKNNNMTDLQFCDGKERLLKLSSCNERMSQLSLFPHLDNKLHVASSSAKQQTGDGISVLPELVPLKGCDLRPDMQRGMSEKKTHEVCQIAFVIDHLTKTAGNNAIIDVGSGLGYLGQVLHYHYRHDVLGLEGKQGHSAGADRRNAKADRCPKLDNVTCEVIQDTESQKEFQSLVSEWFTNIQEEDCICLAEWSTVETATVSMGNAELTIPEHSLDTIPQQTTSKIREKCNSNFSKMPEQITSKGSEMKLCMVGLHCCGDLTPTMLQYFVELDCVTSLCCVSCCYHRMKFDEDHQQYSNFPLSRCLKEAVSKVRETIPDFHFSPYLLRLAAQETRSRWIEQSDEDHNFHMKNVAYRGILETCLVKEGSSYKLKKCVRKLAHRKDYASFDTYIEAVYKHILQPEQVPPEQYKCSFKDEMKQLFDKFHDFFTFIEPITALQFLVQLIIERLIYVDRATWIEEQGFTAEIFPVFDESISPRNLALIAHK